MTEHNGHDVDPPWSEPYDEDNATGMPNVVELDRQQLAALATKEHPCAITGLPPERNLRKGAAWCSCVACTASRGGVTPRSDG